MIEQGLFKRYFVGRDGFIWWLGQVAPESTWAENKAGVPTPNNDSIKGFGERYRVRIMGYHTANIDEIPDNELPWAYVMYPTTAGGGGRSGSQNANISQGDFVFGFFMDGEDAQMPVIMGILAYIRIPLIEIYNNYLIPVVWRHHPSRVLCFHHQA